MKKEQLILLFNRDLNRLRSEIEKYTTDDLLWPVLPGTINSGGNICQHLIGNLRTYIGLALGGVPYIRDREAEFGKRLFNRLQLLDEITGLIEIVNETLKKLRSEDLEKEYPRDVLDMFPAQNTGLILAHLLTHLSYHTGQINYHRRHFTDARN